MELTVDVQSTEVAVVRLKGRLDLLASADFKQRLAEVLADGHHRLVIDLSQVTFIDSSGLGALVSALKDARLAGGDLRIAAPGPQARLTMELTSIDQVLPPYANVEQALSGY